MRDEGSETRDQEPIRSQQGAGCFAMGAKNCNGPARKLFFSDGQKAALALPAVDLDETMEKGDQITDGDVIVLEIRRILLYRCFKQRPEYLVEWTGLDASFNMWIHKDVLEQDVPNMVQAYQALQELHGYKTDIAASRHELHCAVKGCRADLEISTGDAEMDHFLAAYVQKFSAVRALEIQATCRAEMWTRPKGNNEHSSHLVCTQAMEGAEESVWSAQIRAANHQSLVSRAVARLQVWWRQQVRCSQIKAGQIQVFHGGRKAPHGKLKVPTVGQDEWRENDPLWQHEIDALQDHLKTPAAGHEESLAVQRETSVLSSHEVALLAAASYHAGLYEASKARVKALEEEVVALKANAAAASNHVLLFQELQFASEGYKSALAAEIMAVEALETAVKWWRAVAHSLHHDHQLLKAAAARREEDLTACFERLKGERQLWQEQEKELRASLREVVLCAEEMSVWHNERLERRENVNRQQEKRLVAADALVNWLKEALWEGKRAGWQWESDCKQAQIHLLRQEIQRAGMAREEAGRQREARGRLATWGFREWQRAQKLQEELQQAKQDLAISALRWRRRARGLQGDVSVQWRRAEELQVMVHRHERDIEALQGNIKAGELTGEELQGENEALQGKLKAAEGEKAAVWQRLLAYRECLVQQSEQLPCQHARQEEVPVGEEGYCSERAKVQSEASDRLCVFKKNTEGKDFDDNGRDHMITESDIWHKVGNERHRRLNRVLGSSYMRWRNHVIQETQRRSTAVKGVLRLMTGALTCLNDGLVVSIFERWRDRSIGERTATHSVQAQLRGLLVSFWRAGDSTSSRRLRWGPRQCASGVRGGVRGSCKETSACIAADLKSLRSPSIGSSARKTCCKAI